MQIKTFCNNCERYFSITPVEGPVVCPLCGHSEPLGGWELPVRKKFKEKFKESAHYYWMVAKIASRKLLRFVMRRGKHEEPW